MLAASLLLGIGQAFALSPIRVDTPMPIEQGLAATIPASAAWSTEAKFNLELLYNGQSNANLAGNENESLILDGESHQLGAYLRLDVGGGVITLLHGDVLRLDVREGDLDLLVAGCGLDQGFPPGRPFIARPRHADATLRA